MRSVKKRQRGSALLVVLVIMTVLASFAMTNGVALVRLRKFLNGVEQRQVERLERSTSSVRRVRS